MLVRQFEKHSKNSSNTELDWANKDEFEPVLDLILSLPDTETEHIYNVDKGSVIQLLVDCWAICPPVVCRKDGIIVGVMLLDLCSNWWNKHETFYYNPVLYIRPEYRSIKLLKAFCQKGEEYATINNREFHFSLFLVADLDVKHRLMKILGYKPVGIYYTKVK